MKELLISIDTFLYNFLQNNIENMPKRFCKFFAYYYPDARIRKKYLSKLNVYMGEGTYSNIGFIPINDSETPIYIGNNVSIAPNLICVASSAANNGTEINTLEYVKNKLTKSAPISIDDNVWIGANVTILPGVNIGKCSVIGAGSVVICDVESYSVYAGVPAKKIMSLLKEK